ncbi:MAG: OmpH family outer membrane protein [Gammaproteobacteria bacterium]|nr:OmpH family outer membrane protein [Gammaproteobacteria bacterium]NBT45210.1 OmpH family outer membrane protein [Gammaproteobacteria bacterium]NBY24032.1 OmpH family outer membrane protein [Gammaproteobacteria bacterium]
MSKKILVAICGVLLSTGLAAADLKVGVVDLRKLVDQSAQSQKSQAELKKEFQPRENKLVNEQKELKKLEEKLEKDVAVMSEADKRKLEKDLIDRGREFKRAMDEMRQDYGVRANQEMAKIQKVVQEAIQTVAKEQSFDLILVDGVAFAKDSLNVTDEVEKKLAGGTKK